MFSPQDFLLLAVSFGSLLAGILAPELCAPLQSYPVVFMMLLLFLSFLSIRIAAIWDTFPFLRPGGPCARLAQPEN